MSSLHGTRIRWFFGGFAASVFVAPLLAIVLAHTLEQGIVLVTHSANGGFRGGRPGYASITVNVGSFPRPSRVCVSPEDDMEPFDRSTAHTRSLQQAVELAEGRWDGNGRYFIPD